MSSGPSCWSNATHTKTLRDGWPQATVAVHTTIIVKNDVIFIAVLGCEQPSSCLSILGMDRQFEA
ncbi:MAG: hypothetical protein ABSH35_04935 [Isosphaeraceae bacterium]|jgi:hypothetical protein